MKKVLGTALAAGAAILGAAAPAAAETSWSFNLGVASDYIFRGLDQTFTDEDDGQAFGGADLAIDSFYVGAWVSNMGYNDDMGIEYDLYAGFKPELGGVTLDLGAIYYGYRSGDGPGAQFEYGDLSTFELKAAASVPVGGATLGAAVYWTPDYAGDYLGDSDDNDGFYLEANAAYTFSNKATLSGAIGQQSVDDYAVDSYVTMNAGVTFPITDNLSIDGRVIINDDDAAAYDANDGSDKVIGTLKATF